MNYLYTSDKSFQQWVDKTKNINISNRRTDIEKELQYLVYIMKKDGAVGFKSDSYAYYPNKTFTKFEASDGSEIKSDLLGFLLDYILPDYDLKHFSGDLIYDEYTVKKVRDQAGFEQAAMDGDESVKESKKIKARLLATLIYSKSAGELMTQAEYKNSKYFARDKYDENGPGRIYLTKGTVVTSSDGENFEARGHTFSLKREWYEVLQEALGSRNRDYKTSARSINNNLRKHNKRMQELIAQGVGRDEASKQAYDELQKAKAFKGEENMKDKQIEKAITSILEADLSIDDIRDTYGSIQKAVAIVRQYKAGDIKGAKAMLSSCLHTTSASITDELLHRSVNEIQMVIHNV